MSNNTDLETKGACSPGNGVCDKMTKDKSDGPATQPQPQARPTGPVAVPGPASEAEGQPLARGGKRPNPQGTAANPSPAVFLYNTEAAREILKGIRLAATPEPEADTETIQHTDSALISGLPSILPNELSVSDKKACSLCDVEFDDRPEQFQHFKSDWHRFNLKQRLRGCAAVTVDKFEELMGDVSSISGSEPEDVTSEYDTDHGRDSPGSGSKAKRRSAMDRLQAVIQDRGSSGTDSEAEGAGHIEGIGRRHPKVFLKNNDGELLSVYRCVIHSKQNQPETPEDLLSLAGGLPDAMQWAVVMVAGGHFAAAVFDKSEVVAHKTFHRYVVRAKRGTAQSTRDAQGNAPKSAGARLRRYNEQALKEDISELLTEQWKEHLANCDRIFLRAPSYNKATFFGGKKALFDKHDSRVRMIPFQTRRPTLNEVYRVHQVLASLSCHGKDSRFTDHIVSPKKAGLQKEDSLRKSKESTGQKQGLLKSKPAQRVPDKAESSDDSSSDEDEQEILLRMVEETTLTSELREFECTHPPRRRKKKDKPVKGIAHNAVKTGVVLDEETVLWRNKVYTACKNGDVDNLRQLIEKFCDHSSAKSEMKNDTPAVVESCEKVDVLPHQITSDSQTVSHESSQVIEESSSKQVKTDGQGSWDQPHSSSCPASLGSAQSLTEGSQPPTGQVGQDCKVQKVLESVLNLPFGDGKTTLLHVAAKSGHGHVAWVLMENGADVAVRDKSGQLPYQVATEKQTRNEFRKFRTSYPDRYEYNKAQIPEPLTAEREEEKKAKDAERKKAQRKARKEKLKDQKAEQAKQREEERRRHRFLALSDREKRALAAEKRLASQMTDQGKTTPVLSRCFQCATDMTGKVPFEYYDFKFCSSKCLQKHKQMPKPAS